MRLTRHYHVTVGLPAACAVLLLATCGGGARTGCPGGTPAPTARRSPSASIWESVRRAARQDRAVTAAKKTSPPPRDEEVLEALKAAFSPPAAYRDQRDAGPPAPLPPPRWAGCGPRGLPANGLGYAPTPGILGGDLDPLGMQ